MLFALSHIHPPRTDVFSSRWLLFKRVGVVNLVSLINQGSAVFSITVKAWTPKSPSLPEQTDLTPLCLLHAVIVWVKLVWEISLWLIRRLICHHLLNVTGCLNCLGHCITGFCCYYVCAVSLWQKLERNILRRPVKRETMWVSQAFSHAQNTWSFQSSCI